MDTLLNDKTLDFASKKFSVQNLKPDVLFRLAYSTAPNFPSGKWFTSDRKYAVSYKDTHKEVALKQNKLNKPYLYECELNGSLDFLVYQGASFSNDIHELYSHYMFKSANNAAIIDRLEFILNSKDFISIDGFFMVKNSMDKNSMVDEFFFRNATHSLKLIHTTIV